MTIKANEPTLEELRDRALDWLERACVSLAAVADLAEDEGLRQRVRVLVHDLRIERREVLSLDLPVSGMNQNQRRA